MYFRICTTSTTTTTTARPKVTVATSRNTFQRPTTTPADKEYEDEDEPESEAENLEPKILKAEENPRVNNELLNLIKKYGGIDKLEKQLRSQARVLETKMVNFKDHIQIYSHYTFLNFQ